MNCRCVCRPLILTLTEEETEAGIEEILQEVEENGIMPLTRKMESGMERRTENQGEFAHLQIPMQERYVDRLCKKHDLDISGITIKIQRDPAWLNTAFAGMADPKNIGRIDLLPNAFIDEEQLIRTVIHEGAHVKQYTKYGSRYVQENRRRMEMVAERYENLFYNIVRRRKK